MTWHQFRATKGEPLGFLCMVNAERDKPQLPTPEDVARLREIPPSRLSSTTSHDRKPTGPVLWSVDGRGVATVTLNRPEVNNAYNGDLIDGVLAALDALGATRACAPWC